ncbi:MAG: hypothetical protein HY291_03170 [Planctomycetes bacterium]|nr:hypothetical protein [Planctomycetota bacterium]
MGSDDGVVAWLNGERVHADLRPRGFRYGEGYVPIKLKQGRNLLLLKITQATGAWCFSAGLEDAEGRALRDVVPTLEKEQK